MRASLPWKLALRCACALAFSLVRAYELRAIVDKAELFIPPEADECRSTG